MSLANYLRYQRQATGTKIVCEEGDCGACTVLLGKPQGDQLAYQPVNSCIQFLYQLDGAHVVTVEGLKVNGALNPVQEAMVNCHGAQCGYCTPGFVVTMCALFDPNLNPDSTEAKPVAACGSMTAQKVKDALTGNLCRCTGYEPIIRAGLSVDSSQITPLDDLYPVAPILAAYADLQAESILIETPPVNGNAAGRIFFGPVSVREAVAFKSQHPGTVIVSGGTDVGVVCNKRGLEPAVIMSASRLPDLDTIRLNTTDNESPTVSVGARVTLSALERFMESRVPELFKILNVFGAPQIKNAGTLAGNIANGSPIGDSLPFLMAMDAEVELSGLDGARRVNMNQLYTGYRKLDMKPDELIIRIYIPLPGPAELLKLYKVSKRKHLDISAFTAAIRLTQSTDGRIEAVRVAYGGVGPVVMRLPQTEAFLLGKDFTEAVFREGGKIARREITPISDVRGSSAFRLQLAENILLKFYLETCLENQDGRAAACP